MELRGEEGTYFSLSLSRPEYLWAGPVEEASSEDGWLEVSIRVHAPQGSWNARFPCLQEWEARDLARWLELVADDQEVDPLLEFGEPNLAFEKVAAFPDRVTLRVHLRAEFRPPWAPPPEETHDTGAGVDLTVPRAALKAAAAELRRQLVARR